MQSIFWNYRTEAELPQRGQGDFDRLASIECLVYVKGQPWGVRLGTYNFGTMTWFIQGVGGDHNPEENQIYFAPINLPE